MDYYFKYFNSIKVRLKRTTIIKRFSSDDISIP